MLDSILDGLKGQMVSAITDKTGLDIGQAEQAIPLAKESVTEGLTGALGGGNVGGIVDLLKNVSGAGENSASGLMQNLVYKSIAGKFIDKATSALGIPENVAAKVSSFALPMILDKVSGKVRAAGDTDEIDSGSVVSALGLNTDDLADKAKDLLGGKGLGNLLG